MPTTFDPVAETVTSPGPTPAKQTKSPHESLSNAPRCTCDPSIPTSVNARTQTSPSHHIDVETSSTHNSSVRGMTMSSQTCSHGSRNTTPPPLLRRTTSIFPRAHASASTRSGVWREPSTSAVCRIRTSNTDRSGVNVRACCSDALQCSCCTTHCALRGLGKILLPHLGHTAH
ncbi:unannotated protein [freshwater metagenome]|uniref:Unannotated protein n=1 Tax=freshwater metagenome TaxID=449393 RepID=A0A6J6QKZ2_9ZZZZ